MRVGALPTAGNISSEVGPHNLYNVDDFCPSMNPDNSSGFELDDWEAAMAVREDGSMPRMDKLLHAAPTCVTPPELSPSPLAIVVNRSMPRPRAWRLVIRVLA